MCIYILDNINYNNNEMYLYIYTHCGLCAGTTVPPEDDK